MAMKYKYRFIYAVLISLIIIFWGFYRDLQPKLHELGLLQNKVVLLKSRMDYLQKTFAHNSISKQRLLSPPQQNSSPEMVLTAILNTAALNGLVVQSTKIGMLGSDKNNQTLPVYLSFLSDFNHFMLFVQALASQHYPIMINHFLLKLAEQNQISIELNLIIFSRTTHFLAEKNLFITKSNFFNPFCLTENTSGLPIINPISDSERLQKWPLLQLKMIGYLQEAHRLAAIVLLPDGALVDVVAGSKIGKEQGVVSLIKQDRIVILLANQKIYQIFS